jgi:Sortilin, neurotensin receptor 3,/BNR/Asp-box repeat
MRQNGFHILAAQGAVLALATLLSGETRVRFAGPAWLLQADPHHRDTILAGTAAAQMFRSRDGGETWSPIPFPAARRSALHAILIDSTKENVYLVGVSSESPEYAGLFRSDDEGATWRRARGLEQKQIWALASWKGDERVIAAGAQDGVFLTHDAGATWTRLASPRSLWPYPVVSLAFDPKDSKILYAGTPHLAWKTSDGGLTWHRLPRGMQDDSDIFSIDVDARERSRVLAGACSGLYSSLDGGGTWSNLERATGGAHRTYVVTRAPFRPNTIFAGTSGGLIQSSDSGVTWHKRAPEAARSIAFDPSDPLRMFVATDQGILRSEDGGVHFRPASKGLVN